MNRRDFTRTASGLIFVPVFERWFRPLVPPPKPAIIVPQTMTLVGNAGWERWQFVAEDWTPDVVLLQPEGGWMPYATRIPVDWTL